jgi:hypothetical protein
VENRFTGKNFPKHIVCLDTKILKKRGFNKNITHYSLLALSYIDQSFSGYNTGYVNSPKRLRKITEKKLHFILENYRQIT